MGGHSTKITHEYINKPDDQESSGFHVFELHVGTIKYSLLGVGLLVCCIVAAIYFWRRCRRNVQRRQWRRVLGGEAPMRSTMLPLSSRTAGGPLPSVSAQPAISYRAPAVSQVPLLNGALHVNKVPYPDVGAGPSAFQGASAGEPVDGRSPPQVIEMANLSGPIPLHNL